MKTSHQLARELLKGPDLPIYTPPVARYDDSSEHLPEPIVCETDGETWDDKPCKLLFISHAPIKGKSK